MLVAMFRLTPIVILLISVSTSARLLGVLRHEVTFLYFMTVFAVPFHLIPFLMNIVNCFVLVPCPAKRIREVGDSSGVIHITRQ